ncbi:hypothetical protein T4D_3852 [Trichinella pseudospiralis]|uniref:PiggyBac transposable element-derived protein domain-containing protein n=1 Tax=Trichinella pseudospiralis TaxID=6337 RepID=A0A0V1FE95_TRIPS|nr:hypothetical protein T4D_3852 [Trichinella pseudospiralis]
MNSLLLSRGKRKLQQYIRCQPNKWGFKVISCAGQSGLRYDFEFYDMKNLIVEDPLPFQPATYVLKLCETLPKNRNHKLFFNNYYTFLELHMATAKKWESYPVEQLVQTDCVAFIESAEVKEPTTLELALKKESSH